MGWIERGEDDFMIYRRDEYCQLLATFRINSDPLRNHCRTLQIHNVALTLTQLRSSS